MKNIGGVWLPDGELHMIDIMTGPKQRVVDGKITYQYRKLERAMSFIPENRRRRCIDVGGHAGTWSMWLVRHFAHVDAFEPLAEHCECFRRNVAAENVTLHPFALGSHADRVAMKEVPTSTGSAHVWGKGDIEMRTLDSFAFQDVDFIKIDVEGLELEVCQGAEHTIAEHRPYMVVEQKGNEIKKYNQPKRDLAAAWLMKLGMKRLDVMGGDWIMGW